MGPRRSGFWASVKRVLGGGEASDSEPPVFLDLVVSSATPSAPSGQAPPTEAAPRDFPWAAAVPPQAPARQAEPEPPFLSREEEREPKTQAAPTPTPGSVSAPEKEEELRRTAAPAPVPEPEGVSAEQRGATSKPPAPPPAGAGEESTAPRLARGLASFSSRNSERGRRFAHLLNDEPSAGKKPRSGRGGRPNR